MSPYSLAWILQTTSDPTPPIDDFAPGLGIFVLFMLGAFLMLLITAAAVVGAFAGATIAAGLTIIACAVLALLLLTVVAHLILATIIWTRRPPTRVLMHKRWWGLLALPAGLFSAVPFFALHYRPGAPRRCFRCSYDRTGLARRTLCPECGG